MGDWITYHLFDNLASEIVGEAIRNGLILPSQGAEARMSHGGLSGDLLQRFPQFERATVPDVLDIRRELAEHLDAFREVVTPPADVIGLAPWKEECAEEAERIFRERVSPAIHRIEQAAEESHSGS
jgi:hypothetical protein